MGAVFVDANGLKEINDTVGHEASVCAKQHFGIAQLSELITVDRN